MKPTVKRKFFKKSFTPKNKAFGPVQILEKNFFIQSFVDFIPIIKAIFKFVHYIDAA